MSLVSERRGGLYAGETEGSERLPRSVLGTAALSGSEQREAAENFAEVIAILRNWGKAERGEMMDEDARPAGDGGLLGERGAIDSD